MIIRVFVSGLSVFISRPTSSFEGIKIFKIMFWKVFRTNVMKRLMIYTNYFLCLCGYLKYGSRELRETSFNT